MHSRVCAAQGFLYKKTKKTEMKIMEAATKSSPCVKSPLWLFFVSVFCFEVNQKLPIFKHLHKYVERDT